ncbi:MAG: PIN domain-containing protein [Acidobacteria bacterium]|nr:PIN domain-containing protein [Acidobacteriota bacterium]
MAPLIYLDTHVVVWLFAGRIALFPARARSLLETSELYISPIVTLEIEYLIEIRRVSEPCSAIIESLQREIGLRVCELPFAGVIEIARKQTWTRDPFDRIVVGQAALRDAPLLTGDRTIRQHYASAAWD